MAESRMWKLQQILESYAPSDNEKNNCRSVYAKMIDNNEPAEVIERQIIGALSDGIKYGNWPWTIIN